MVGANIGARQIQRTERIGTVGAGLAATLTGSVGMMLAIFPHIWMALFTDDALTHEAGAAYLRIVGPAFVFFGVGLALYFASQGAQRVNWPVVATVVRFVVAVGGAGVLVRYFDGSLDAVYAAAAVAMILYGAITGLSVRLGAWRTGRLRSSST